MIAIYLLTSYLRKFQKDEKTIGKQLRQFVITLKKDLASFSIYDPRPPKGMSRKKFEIYVEYKNWARKAATEDSLKRRFEIMIQEYKKQFKNTKFHTKSQLKISNALPEPLPDQIARKSFEEKLKEEESAYLEFKSSMIYDIERKVPSKDIKREVAISIAAFSNTDGGILIIGVGPKKQPYGIENDYKTFSKEQNWDQWLRAFSDLIDSDIDVKITSSLDVKNIVYDGKPFAIIKIPKGIEPAYIAPKNEQEFYIRSQNRSKKLKPKDAIEYAQKRFRQASIAA